ncbi:MAG: helix-turn-helix domain-containing protein [Desulfobacterales bacterium]
MDKDNQLLTTREFASRTGLQASKVSKLIRQGKIEAKKKSGKWLIHPNQLQAKAVQRPDKGGKSTAKPKTAKKTSHKKAAISAKKTVSAAKEIENSAGRSYTVSEFVEMTYLTELGVGQWLKLGRLTGHQNEKGDWLIDAANLQVPDIRRLLREAKAP